MTIDEAIKCEKEKSEHAKEEYLMLQDDNCTDVETYEKRLNNCASFAEYHEQLAEWLEELKIYKESNISIKNYHQGRTDAIDECIAELEEDYKRASENVKYPEYDYYCNGIEDCIDCLEQLKEKEKLTCLDCRHHFMSDCYLECYKNNRINNNKVCDEFEQLKERNNDSRNI